MSAIQSAICHEFKEALLRVGITQESVARRARIEPAQLSKLLNGKAVATPSNTERMRRVARALMAEALKRGWSDDAVWELNEQQLFGLPGELDRERVMAEVKAKAGEVRSA